jgi:quercetin dioxygenase-like cupin family protein
MAKNGESPEYVTWADVAAEEVLPGIMRQTVHGARQTMVRYLYEPGSVFPVHAHPEEQVTVVVRGRITFQIGNQWQELGPGQVAIIPGSLPHGAQVTGTEQVETYNALSPRRTTAPAVDDRSNEESE